MLIQEMVDADIQRLAKTVKTKDQIVDAA